jgi:segregation and condensation protein B
MSLKAKLEAVIYASEEPVTLVQLIGLLGEEGQGELDALAAQQQSLDLEANAPSGTEDLDDALNAEIFDSSEVDNPEPSQAEPEPTVAAPTADSCDTALADTSDVPASDEKKLAREAASDQKTRDRKLRDYFRSLLDQLIAEYATGDRGLEIREVAGGFRLATKPEYHDAVRGFVKSLKPPLKLTLQALETLAVVAYKQPVTSPEVSEIRGVESAGTLGSLMTRKLVTTAGRKQVIGRPILYKTTKDFLLRFGLKDIAELPSIEEFEKMAGELNDAIQEEIPMEPHEQNPHDPEAALDGTSAPVSEAAAEPTHMHHDTPEDLMSDKSTSPEGNRLEQQHPGEFEAMANVHSDQADGTPEDETDEDA